MPTHKKILFLYPDPPGFSGQRRAAELMLDVLEDSEQFSLIPVKLPGRPKTGGGLAASLKFLFTTVRSVILVLFHALFSRIDGLFIAACQTRSTLIREDIFTFLIRLLSRRSNLPIGFGLNGSNFTRWSGEEAVAKKFRKVLSKGKFVSVLGPTQKKIMEEKFSTNELTPMIVPNTCEFEMISEAEIREKQTNEKSINVLHLSSLMEPKGYIQVVQAIPKIASETHFTVCGKITSTQYDQRFKSVSEASHWLEKESEKQPRLQWLKGAYGEEKKKLFLAAHIFVMPTDYPVEAQPLVLLEAMACGCVVVTTDVGEIGYMVDDSNAIILARKEAGLIAEAVNRLIDDRQLRIELAISARKRFLDRFSKKRNRSMWHEIFAATY